MKKLFGKAWGILGGVFLLSSCAGPSEYDRADSNDDQKLSTEEVEDRLVEAIFEEQDRNHDGRLTATEWSVANPDCPVGHFQSRDLNGDQVLELQEFQTYADATNMFDKALLKLDPNGDGFISASESQKILESLGQ